MDLMNERDFSLVLHQVAVSRFPPWYVVRVNEHNAATIRRMMNMMPSERTRTIAHFGSRTSSSQHRSRGQALSVSCISSSIPVFGSTNACSATAGVPQESLWSYTSSFANSMISSFMRYCWDKSTTASGCAVHRRRKRDSSRPARRASRDRTRGGSW